MKLIKTPDEKDDKGFTYFAWCFLSQVLDRYMTRIGGHSKESTELMTLISEQYKFWLKE
jgi:hypothetical protein